jgi:hypothetical protein
MPQRNPLGLIGGLLFVVVLTAARFFNDLVDTSSDHFVACGRTSKRLIS